MIPPFIPYTEDERTGLFLHPTDTVWYFDLEFLLSYHELSFFRKDPGLGAMMTSPSADMYTGMAHHYLKYGAYKSKKERWYFAFCQYCKKEQKRAIVAGAMFALLMKLIANGFPYLSTRFLEKAYMRIAQPNLSWASACNGKSKFPWSEARKCYATYKHVLHFWAALVMSMEMDVSSETRADYFYVVANTFRYYTNIINFDELSKLNLIDHPWFKSLGLTSLHHLFPEDEQFRKTMYAIYNQYREEKSYSERSTNYSTIKKKK